MRTNGNLEDVAAARAWAATGVGRQVRLGARLSLRELARELDVSGSTILRWERGEMQPRAEQAIAYASVLRRLMGGES